MENIESGYLRIMNEADRLTVASILFANGYTVKKVRRKKNGKAFEYFVSYELANPDDMPGGDAYEG